MNNDCWAVVPHILLETQFIRANKRWRFVFGVYLMEEADENQWK